MTGFALGLLMFGAAACGAEESPGIATAGGTPTSTASAAAQEGSPVAYAACMREHGVPMEDPETDAEGHVNIKLTIPKGMDKAKVDAAQEECRKLMPSGGTMGKPDAERLERTREMARCMRENGVPGFPDPNAEGGIAITPDSGVNPDDPAFKAAQEKCEPADAGPRVEEKN
ncbi:hypothetical protein [Actinocorallia aurea]